MTRFNEFLQDISIPTGTLIMDSKNRIVRSHLNASSNDSVQFIFHFSVASLNGIEVQFRFVVTLNFNWTCGTTTNTDSIDWTTNLCQQHSTLRVQFFSLCRIHDAETGTEHYWLHVFVALVVSIDNSVRDRETRDYWLSKLVAIVRRSVTRFDDYFQWTCKWRWVLKVWRFVGQLVVRNVEISNAITSSASDCVTTSPNSLNISNSTTSTSRCATERSNSRRHVVSLGCEYQVGIDFIDRDLSWSRKVCGSKRLMLEASNRATVITELDCVVVIRIVLRFDDHLNQWLFFLVSFDNHFSFEEPMTRMFAVGLSAIEKFDTRRIAFQDICEQVCVVVDVPIVECKSQLWVNFNQSLLALTQHRNEVPSVVLRFW